MSETATHRPKNAQAIADIRAWLSSRCGIMFPDHKVPLLQQRMTRVMHSHGMADLGHLSSALIEDAREDVQLAVMHAASTNHTYFWREPEVLARFQKLVLDDLPSHGDIRIWSAACSTGDELYTIAMLVAETMGPSALSRLHLLGTDISQPVIEKAELGVYPARSLIHTAPEMVRRYFDPVGIDQYRVKDALRARCIFRRMNLKATPYPFSGKFRAVFCRNVLYYFDREDQRATLDEIYHATEPGGWLITSVTESIRDLGSRWVGVEAGLYRRVD